MEKRRTLEKVAAAHALLAGCEPRASAGSGTRCRARVTDACCSRSSWARLVRIADHFEDVHAADAGLPRDVHGPVWQLRSVDHHLRKAQFRRRLVLLLHG